MRSEYTTNNLLKLMNQKQKQFYISTADWVLYHHPREKLNRCFEMSIDLCEQVDWDQEEECGDIWDLLIEERGLDGCYTNKLNTKRFKK